jgi:hypothetical protein
MNRPSLSFRICSFAMRAMFLCTAERNGGKEKSRNSTEFSPFGAFLTASFRFAPRGD